LAASQPNSPPPSASVTEIKADEDVFWAEVTMLMVGNRAPITPSTVGSLVTLSAGTALHYLCALRHPPVGHDALLHGLEASLALPTPDIFHLLLESHSFSLPELQTLRQGRNPAHAPGMPYLKEVIRLRKLELHEPHDQHHKAERDSFMQRVRSWMRQVPESAKRWWTQVRGRAA
jgi:hypothetical protein